MMAALAELVNRSVTAVVAAAPPTEPDPLAGKGPEWGKAAPSGLLVWLFLGIALFLLIKSMNKHLRRVPKNEDGRPSTALVSDNRTWVPRPPRRAGSAGSAGAGSGVAGAAATTVDDSGGVDAGDAAESQEADQRDT